MGDDATDREGLLEGWKEISSFLKRDESTARRWEREEGLPVHRHEHKIRSSVYARRRELEAWRATRGRGAARRPEGRRRPSAWLASAAALILLARGDGLARVAEAQDSALGMRTVEVCAGCDWAGSVSPDGRSISETDWDTWNVGLRDLETGELRLLTGTGSNGQAIGGPSRHVFSPDGQSLAFGWHTHRSELRRISVDERGGAPRLVYSDEDLEQLEAQGWSPSDEILVTANRADWTTLLGFVPARGGELRVVKTLPHNRSSVRLSPDGKWIAYDVPSKDHAPSRDVYLLAADGSQEALVSGHRANDYVVGFTAGSGAVLFASNRTGSYGLWAAEILENGVTGDPHMIQRDTGALAPLSITPDGALYYARASGTTDVFTAEVDLASGRLVSVPRMVAGRWQGANRGPLWSPDGSFLVYRSTESLVTSGAVRLVVRSWPGGDEREVVPEGIEISPYHPMHFSPDGERLMLSARDTRDRWGIYAVDLQTAAAELLMRQPQDRQLRSCGWGADGKTWYYVLQYEEGGGTHSIYRMDPGATQGRQIYSISDRGHGGKIMKSTLSPNRELLAFRVLGNQEIWVLPLHGGDAVKVHESSDGGWPVNPAWTPEGDALVAIVHTSPQSVGMSQRILRIPIDGSPASEVEPLGDRMSDLSIHPDGRTVLYHRYPKDVRIWKMENYWSPPSVAEVTR